MPDSSISLDQVRHVARLARLEFAPAEELSLQADLNAILTYVDKLNKLDTTQVEPTAQVGEAGTPKREDVVLNQPDPDAMLANAPARLNNFFRVPKIIE